MKKVISVIVRDKIATAGNDALYICGNSDYVAVFDFDSEWEQYDTKTARFVWNGQHQDVVFSGNECPVPVISDTHSFRLGCFAGNLKTSTAAYVCAKKGILCGSGLPAAPADDVYAQIMERLNNLDGGNGVTKEELEAEVDKALQEAKESGDFDGKDGKTPVKGVDYFDGEPGKDGADGKDGKTPVKGVDYWTEADKAEMVSDVIASLPVYNGEVAEA